MERPAPGGQTLALATARRIVVKIGSATLSRPKAELKALAGNRLCRRHRGAERPAARNLVVSPGAIALGRRRLKLPKGAGA